MRYLLGIPTGTLELERFSLFWVSTHGPYHTPTSHQIILAQ